MHLTIQDQWPDGGCGKGNDNKSHGSDDPHHADAQYHFQGFLASVKPGHEDLAPSVQLGGEEDETPKRLADCKGYFILWPKGLLRVEPAAVMTTPTTTHPQEGMNTTTPPPQLLAPPVWLVRAASDARKAVQAEWIVISPPCSNKQWMMTWTRMVTLCNSSTSPSLIRK